MIYSKKIEKNHNVAKGEINKFFKLCRSRVVCFPSSVITAYHSLSRCNILSRQTAITDRILEHAVAHFHLSETGNTVSERLINKVGLSK